MVQILSKGKYVEALPVENTILMMIGDAFQRWTGDLFTSTVSMIQLNPHSHVKYNNYLQIGGTINKRSIVKDFFESYNRQTTVKILTNPF